MLDKQKIYVYGARENNLQNVDCQLKRNKINVMTGISGCGKSSLAFDTIYAEGQRRYMETFSNYLKQFLGGLKRPDVDKIQGLSPVIAIEQKTTNRNPNSTVGTITEISAFVRLLFARIATPYSYHTGKPMQKLSGQSIFQYVFEQFHGQYISILAPLVKGRKGHYRELFKQMQKKGYLKVRVDGQIKEIEKDMSLERFKIHDIDLVVDRLKVVEANKNRLKESIFKSLHLAGGYINILDQEGNQKVYSKNIMCLDTNLSYNDPQPNTFSFNSPYGWCTDCKGVGYILVLDLDVFIINPNLSIRQGGLLFYDSSMSETKRRIIQIVARKLEIDLNCPIKNLNRNKLFKLIAPPQQGILIHYNYEIGLKPSKLNYHGFRHLLEYSSIKLPHDFNWDYCYKESNCPSCGGSRLKKESLHFKLDNKNIFELFCMNINDLDSWLRNLSQNFTAKQQIIGKELMSEVINRVTLLKEIGLGYLKLTRRVDSLSGGELQRIRLATQIGSKLMNILYVLDEPCIGLHQRDNQNLILALKKLCAFNNTILLVEHDRDLISAADHIIDIGPKGGRLGGEIVASGNFKELIQKDSLTALYLSRKKNIEIPEKRDYKKKKMIVLKGARGNNLKSVDVNIPLETFICVTGVSGSGKSSLIIQTLYPLLKNKLNQSFHTPSLPVDSIQGTDNIDKVIQINQSPIGKTPRSNPVTYTGIFTDIRNLFSQLPEAKIRGYKAGRFSFNIKGGRCENCKGGGQLILKMSFLPDVQVKCTDCQGYRYNAQTLEVRWKGKNIYEVLEMSIEEAFEFFSNIPNIKNKIRTLKDIGLGYIKLGQASTTLSGGEAQRIKLSAELSKRSTGKTMYILDEPTTGLHFEDIKFLNKILFKLVEKKNTVIVIEHNMDVIKVADYIVDIGPEGGENGGKVLFQGTPDGITKLYGNLTGKFLAIEMKGKVGAE